MAWYDRLIGKKLEDTEEKLNPAQPYYDHKVESSREFTFRYERAYEDIEIVNRGVNMIVDERVRDSRHCRRSDCNHDERCQRH